MVLAAKLKASKRNVINWVCKERKKKWIKKMDCGRGFVGSDHKKEKMNKKKSPTSFHTHETARRIYFSFPEVSKFSHKISVGSGARVTRSGQLPSYLKSLDWQERKQGPRNIPPMELKLYLVSKEKEQKKENMNKYQCSLQVSTYIAHV